MASRASNQVIGIKPNTRVIQVMSVRSYSILLFILCAIYLGLTQQSHAETKSPATQANASCAPWLSHSVKQLHSDNTIDLCKKTHNKPLLIVNTASHCGFTYQFKNLEAIHQRYKDKGLVVIGFASNDFNQAAKTEKEAATICYENYGVSFTMAAPIKVKGSHAHPLFKNLANKTQAPSWNFNKYLVSADRKNITHFGSTTSPTADRFTTVIDSLIE